MILQNAQVQPWEVVDDYTGQPMPAERYTLIQGAESVPLVMQFRPITRNPWQNAYVLQRSALTDDAITLDMSVTFITPADLANCNCWEFECDIINANMHYNGGWQARFDDGHWWAFNLVSASWVATGIPIASTDFVAGKPTRITAQYQRIPNGLVYEGLCVNGVEHHVAYTGPAVPKTGANHLNWAWQLDSRGHGAPINIALNSYEVYTQ